MKIRVADDAIIGKIDQGVIFNGAIAEDYDSCEVYGLLITASCDIANDKVRKYNYLPVVDFIDWLSRDFWEIFFQRAMKQEKSKLRNQFKQKNLSENLINQFDHNTLYDKCSEDFVKQREKDKFLETVQKIEALHQCDKLSFLDRRKKINEVFSQHNKMVLAIFNELTSQILSGYYFLSQISSDKNDCFYVVLFREIRHLRRSLVNEITKGLSIEGMKSYIHKNKNNSINVNTDYPDMIMPIGYINAPYIQHIMQKFSELYSRIGVEDIDKQINEELLKFTI